MAISACIMAYLDPNAVIPEAKLTSYLLVLLPKDDKSQFLAQAGYTKVRDRWEFDGSEWSNFVSKNGLARHFRANQVHHAISKLGGGKDEISTFYTSCFA